MERASAAALSWAVCAAAKQPPSAGGPMGPFSHSLPLSTHLPALHIVALDAADEQAHIVACLSLVQLLLEHLHAWMGRDGGRGEQGVCQGTRETAPETAGRGKTAAILLPLPDPAAPCGCPAHPSPCSWCWWAGCPQSPPHPPSSQCPAPPDQSPPCRAPAAVCTRLGMVVEQGLAAMTAGTRQPPLHPPLHAGSNQMQQEQRCKGREQLTGSQQQQWQGRRPCGWACYLDGEDVLHRHGEGLVQGAHRVRDVAVHLIHQLQDGLPAGGQRPQAGGQAQAGRRRSSGGGAGWRKGTSMWVHQSHDIHATICPGQGRGKEVRCSECSEG